jgi:hypothetical protein
MHFSFGTGQMLLRTMLSYLLFLQLNNVFWVFCTKKKNALHWGHVCPSVYDLLPMPQVLDFLKIKHRRLSLKVVGQFDFHPHLVIINPGLHEAINGPFTYPINLKQILLKISKEDFHQNLPGYSQ